MKKLLVIDDHPIVLEGIASVLSSNRYKVIKATSAAEALEIGRETPDIDIVICDLSLVEGTDGLTLINMMREEGIVKPTIVYTMHEELWNISALLKTDVEGIVLKGDDIRELVKAIKTVAAGRCYRSAAFDERRVEALNTTGILLSTDIEVLRRISKGDSTRAISEELALSGKAIEYHRACILRKLCSRTMAEATRRAIQLGIIAVAALLMLPSASASEPVAVDLGLSVMWGDRNLGAESPADSGGFYAYGETWTKDYYDWSTYAYCNNGSLFECLDFGTENISGTEFDAARVILGNGWRLPTVEESCELIDKCTVTIADDGSSATVTAANGATLFFPIAGYMSLGRIIHKNNEGVYWTGNNYFECEEWDGELLSVTAPYFFVFTKSGAMGELEGSCHLGLMIRPVRDYNDSVETVETVSDAPAAIFSLDGRPVTAPLAPGIYIVRDADGSTRKIKI